VLLVPRVALLVACILLVCSAASFADVEPNDVISQAEGPLAGGVPISGTLGSANDVDYYYFYVQGQQQIHLDAVGGSDLCKFWLEDTDGGRLPYDYTTPPGLNRYFVHVQDDCFESASASYAFQIDPGSAVVTGPALDRSFVTTGEPNESSQQAAGPLAGGVNYRGSIDTANDQDWFFFYVAPGAHQVDISVTDPLDEGDCEAQVELGDGPYYDEASSASGGWADFGHVRTTLTGPATYHLSASTGGFDCGFGSWQFRIDPADALTPTLWTPPVVAPSPKPAVSAVCRRARGRVVAWSRRVRTLTDQLRHAHGAHSRHVVRVYRKAARRHLRSAIGQRSRSCPGRR
jgi:hypothetical protein